MGGLTAANLDAVTLDAYGTLVELDGHVERLQAALRVAGVDADVTAIEHAWEVEVAYYADHKCLARDEVALRTLRHECAQVFTQALGAAVELTEAFTSAIVFRPLAGVLAALEDLRARGLGLAVVSNWDCSLAGHLAAAGIHVDVVVTCAGAGVAKPSPEIFQQALARLGVSARRALHVGDQPEDEQGAKAAGMAFAPTPLPSVVSAWQ